jgi:hypothetical protein
MSMVKFESFYSKFYFPRSSPALMFYGEGISKFLLICSIAFISIRNYGKKDQEEIAQSNNLSDQTTVILTLSGMIYELGQLQETNWKLSQHFREIWNKLDALSYILISVWIGLLAFPEQFMIARIALGLSAIPLSISLLQYFSSVKLFGELVIMIVAIMGDLMSFLVVFFVCILGFGIAFLGIFNGEPSFHSFGKTGLTLFSASLGTFDFYELFVTDGYLHDTGADRSNMNTLAVLLMVIYNYNYYILLYVIDKYLYIMFRLHMLQ